MMKNLWKTIGVFFHAIDQLDQVRHHKGRASTGRVGRWFHLLDLKEGRGNEPNGHDNGGDGSNGDHAVLSLRSAVLVTDRSNQVLHTRFSSIKGFNRIHTQTINVFTLRFDDEGEILLNISDLSHETGDVRKLGFALSENGRVQVEGMLL